MRNTEYRGYKITVRNGRLYGCKSLVTNIAGFPFDVTTNKTVEQMIDNAKLYIDASIERPDAYTWSRRG